MKYVFFIFLFVPISCWSQYLIEGSIDTSAGYKYVQLDILDQWNQFGSVTDEMTIKTALISDDGTYKIEGNELSNKIGFYRLRFTEGENQVMIKILNRNYINFIFTNNDSIRFKGLFPVPGNSNNDLLIQEIKRDDQFRKETAEPENDKQYNLVLNKYQDYCKQQINQSDNPFINLFNLSNSQLSIQDEPELFKKIHNELSANKILPVYANSLQNEIQLFDFNAVDRKSKWLRNALIGSVLLNLLLLIFIIKAKSSFSKNKNHALVSIKSLTNKEIEVMKLISAQKSNKEISNELFISEATVKTHINNIYRKLGVKSRKEAIELYNS